MAAPRCGAGAEDVLWCPRNFGTGAVWDAGDLCVVEEFEGRGERGEGSRPCPAPFCYCSPLAFFRNRWASSSIRSSCSARARAKMFSTCGTSFGSPHL